VTTLLLVFGLILEFPLLVIGHAAAGVVTAEDSRRLGYGWPVGFAAVTAVEAPGGDIAAPLMRGTAMYATFEVTLLFIGFIGPSRDGGSTNVAVSDQMSLTHSVPSSGSPFGTGSLSPSSSGAMWVCQMWR
jgi:Sec-independent protein secretion pathway component TatC